MTYRHRRPISYTGQPTALSWAMRTTLGTIVVPLVGQSAGWLCVGRQAVFFFFFFSLFKLLFKIKFVVCR